MRKVNSNDSGHLFKLAACYNRSYDSNDIGFQLSHLLFFISVSPGRAGAFSRDFTTSLAPECRAFSGALKIEKLKAPLIPGPEGAVDTNDWCIKGHNKIPQVHSLPDYGTVRPQLEYASTVQYPHTTSDITKPEAEQHRTAR